jgi:hypothetical protein
MNFRRSAAAVESAGSIVAAIGRRVVAESGPVRTDDTGTCNKKTSAIAPTGMFHSGIRFSRRARA